MEPSVTLSSTQSIEQSTSKATPRKPHMFSNTLSGTLQEYPYESPGTRPAGFESTFTEAERDFVRVNHRVDEDDKQKKRRRAANVSGHEDTLGKSQVTVTLNESNPPGSLCISQLMLNEVGMHPWDFGSTLRMVRAIRGAVQARQDTLEKTKIPHRDVSISNVMSNEGTVLIDSDSSKLDSYIPMRTA
ncbi:hypothetical protein MPER_09948 [Moniliophthora perniciosa FA553]|nr:hypothetical protein MPER_09948 [Moniliophthora perniciosa FA553]